MEKPGEASTARDVGTSGAANRGEASTARTDKPNEEANTSIPKKNLGVKHAIMNPPSKPFGKTSVSFFYGRGNSFKAIFKRNVEIGKIFF